MLSEVIRESMRQELVSAIGESKVLWEKADIFPYTADNYVGTMRLGEDFKHFPDLVVLPETTTEVQAVVRLAAEHKIPLLPKGGGSNRAGMLVPYHGGIAIDTIRMNKVVEVSVPNLYVTVQPGITLKELDVQLAPYGLTLNQIQGSYKVATVGGSISTGGFARKHQKYGVISDRVMSLEAVLPDGSVLRTGPKVLYTSTGYGLHQIFVGAEGTLGVITEATLRVEPLPEASRAILAFFDDFWGACEASKRVSASCVTFAGAEAFEVAEDGDYGAPLGMRGVFLIDFEGTKGEVDAEVAYVKSLIEESGGVFGREEDASAIIGDYPLRWCGSRVITGFESELDTYVPVDKLEEFYGRLWNDIMPRYGIKPSPGSAHGIDVGRYRMAYAQFGIPEGQDGWENHQKAMREIAEVATSLGGSISGCIGVGVKHRDLLPLEYSPVALEVMRRIKEVFDPDGIMNPGKKLPPRDVCNRQ